MSSGAKPIPDGYHNLIPHLVVKEANQAIDPFGPTWSLATHKEDLTREEIGKRAQAAVSECGK